MALILSDEQYMRIALNLAARALGRTAPNPAVGCIIVKNGKIIGRGVTAPGGRPHAEVVALNEAGKNAKGAIAYVSLEPCAHHGKTPPCADALIKAGIRKVVMACEDNYTLVSGKGRDALKKAKIEVVEGVLEKEAKTLNAGFISVVRRQRPFVTLKLAATLDGKIATQKGDSRWITGEEARAYGHFLRASHDAVLIGSGTAVKDDPLLTCRLPGLENRSPVRVVADTHLKLPLRSRLLETAKETPLWLFTSEDTPPAEFRKKGAEVMQVKKNKRGSLETHDMLFQLADRGITRLLAEGGAGIAASLIANRYVDRLIVITSGKVLGEEGLSGIGGLNITRLDNAPEFTLESTRRLGGDIAHIYRAE